MIILKEATAFLPWKELYRKVIAPFGELGYWKSDNKQHIFQKLSVKF